MIEEVTKLLSEVLKGDVECSNNGFDRHVVGPPSTTERALEDFLHSNEAVEGLFHEQLQFDGMNLSAVSIPGLRKWLVDRAKVAGPVEAATNLSRYVHEGEFRGSAVMVLTGALVDEESDLGHGVVLAHPGRLIDSRAGRAIANGWQPSLPVARPSGILVKDLTVKREHSPQVRPESYVPSDGRDTWQRVHEGFAELERARLSLVLCRHGGCAAQPIGSTFAVPDSVPLVTGGLGWSSGLVNRPARNEPHLIGSETRHAKLIHEQLSRLTERELAMLRVPITRLGIAAAARFDVVTKGEAVRTALETTFLCDQDKSEMGYRLRVRAARYLGATDEERRSIAKLVNLSYSIGSHVIHTGLPPDESQSRWRALRDRRANAVLDDAMELIRKGVLRRLENPNIDWAAVELS